MFDDFVNILEDGHFEENPVDVKTFVEGVDYLNQPPLSDIQYSLVQSMSQIYKKPECEKLYGFEEGRQHHEKYTKGEFFGTKCQ